MAVDPWVCGAWTLRVPTQSQHVQLTGKRRSVTRQAVLPWGRSPSLGLACPELIYEASHGCDEVCLWVAVLFLFRL